MKWLSVVLTVTILIPVAMVGAQETDSSDPLLPRPERTLTVGTKQAVPFVIKGPDGRWAGISVELLEQVMRELGWRYQWREGSLEELLGGVESGELDLAIAAITITPEREVRHDFSHGYYSTGLGIAVSGQGGGWKGFLRRLFSGQLLGAVGLTIVLLLIVGLLIWLAERKRNPDQFGGTAAKGVGAGFWFSAVTMTTVGYGDKAPVTTAGRGVALIWMFASLIAISSLTAAITSALTLNELESGIAGPADLPRVKVGTVAASTSLDYLEQRGMTPRQYPSVGEALRALNGGDVEAVVYDAPILRYSINEQFQGDVMLLPEQFDQQSYGVLFGSESELREPFNRALLRVLEDPSWQGIMQRYMGSAD